MGQKIRVLLLSPLPPPIGGIASWTVQYISQAENYGIEVSVVSNAITGKRIENNRIKILEELKRSKNIFNQITSKIKIDKPDIIHINSSCSRFGIIRDFICAKIAKSLSIPIVVHYHCNIVDQINNKFQKKFFQKLTNVCSSIIVLNDASKEYINKYNNSIKVYKIPNFIDSKMILREKKKFNEKIESVIFVGRVTKEKGICELLEVAYELPKISFIIAGPIEKTNNKSLELPSNLKFLGVLNKREIIDLLDKSDVFLLPSYSEGFSIALLEAMARGLPIITTNVGDNYNMIANGGGHIVRMRDSQSIIDALTELTEVEEREKISINNINKVDLQYTLDAVLPNIKKIYLETIDM